MKIEVKNLHKSFGDNVVFRGLDLTIPEGEISIILGGSGSGKSVLLKHLIGLMKPDSGEILIDGKDITTLSERDMFPLRRRMGMIFQTGGILASLPVGENVALGLKEHRLVPKNEIPEIVREKLAVVNLEGKENEMPANLSGGMKKRVSIARALTLNPELFLYDEPTSGLDPPMAEKIDELILDLTEELNATSVVVTHDLDSVKKLNGIVNMLHEGRIVESAPADEFVKSEKDIVKNFLSRGHLAERYN